MKDVDCRHEFLISTCTTHIKLFLQAERSRCARFSVLICTELEPGFLRLSETFTELLDLRGVIPQDLEASDTSSHHMYRRKRYRKTEDRSRDKNRRGV